MSTPRIMFYVQYLLGIGHVRRSSLIVQALCEQGVHVDVIFGGMPVPSMSFGNASMHFLEAIKSADAAFSGLQKADGSEFTKEDQHHRSQALLQLCEQLQPDLIVTETYPFGRRQMRFELLPLLNWIKSQANPPILVASIRDILQRRSPVREQECIDLINQHYQHVLVHGDPQFYPLQQSFPPAAQIQHKISYSGYVCPTFESSQQPKAVQGETNTASDTAKIVVSIGGGSVGKEILQAALMLYQSGYAPQRQWLLVTGPNMSAADKQYFHDQQTDNLQVTELADNFLAKLNDAYVSVSMAGYNTVMDLLLTQTPAVVVPFEGDGETEQLARSKVLATRGVLQLLENSALTANSLQQAIEKAVASPINTIEIANQGAQRSAQLLTNWALKLNS
ncbi:MAG: glycosyltransferase [Oceanospirillaceae bacterium]